MMLSHFLRLAFGSALFLVVGELIPVKAADFTPANTMLDPLNPLATGVAMSVFNSSTFPEGLFEEEAVIRDALGKRNPNAQVVITYYNDQFQEVKQADKPGRYGVVVQLKGAGLRQYSTLYRLSGAEPDHPELGLNMKNIGQITPADSARWAILLTGLSENAAATPTTPAAEVADAWARDAAWWGTLRTKLKSVATYQYLVDLPTGYDKDTTQKWPLIFFLHGSGERGNDLTKLRAQGLPKVLANGNKFPAIIISPQCPNHEWWQTSLVVQVLADLSTKYRIDPDRIYVTGLSMGGFGSWALGLAFPDRFAALAPVCGASDPTDAARLKNLPVWAFHGLDDQTVPVAGTTQMIEALRQAGGKPHETLYPGVGHGCWHIVYDTDALYRWLFAQKRGQPEVLTAGLPTQ